MNLVKRLETERIDENHVAVYFPGSLNAWSSVVHIVASHQVERLDLPVSAVIEHAEQLGFRSPSKLADARTK